MLGEKDREAEEQIANGVQREVGAQELEVYACPHVLVDGDVLRQVAEQPVHLVPEDARDVRISRNL